MWLRSLVNYPKSGYKLKDVFYTDYASGTILVDKGWAARCTGPSGVSYEEAAPEDVQENIDRDTSKKTEKEKTDHAKEVKKRQGYYF